MEARQMMAGDVVAFMSGGNLVIQESFYNGNTDNHIQVSSLPNGNIRVTGAANADGSVTMIGTPQSRNVTSYKDFSLGNGGIIITTGGGNDVVETMPFTGIQGRLTVNTMGSGPNDHDQVYIDGTYAKKGIEVSTGVGNDIVDMRSVRTYGDVASSLTVNTGAGSDYVRIFGTTYGSNIIDGLTRIQTYTSMSENDADTVEVFDAAFQNLGVLTGDGSDRVTVERISVSKGGVAIYADDEIVGVTDGADTVTLRNVAARDYIYNSLGGGNDMLTLSGMNTPYLMAHGDAGYDMITFPAEQSFYSLTGFELIKPLYKSVSTRRI